MKSHHRSFLTLSFVLTILTLLVFLPEHATAGDLEPPGPPGPTMKTLDEVEARTPISSLPIIISGSGSYYLTSNLVMPTVGNGINISADNVTLDLNGFALIGGPGSDNGIAVNDPQSNICILNGTIRGWGGDGISGLNARNSRLENLRVSDNTGIGLKIGRSSTVTNCSLTRNDGGGLVGEFNCIVSYCTVDYSGGNGITTSTRCIVNNCMASYNGGDGIEAAGGSRIEGCVASSNTGNGIKVNFYCYVLNNDCGSNGLLDGDGAGVLVTGNGNRIEGNHVTENDRGIDVDGILNIIIKNTARGSDGYTIGGSQNSYGPIVNISSGGDISSLTSHPWANFQF
jgi:parallel beta-helix repeat protein